MPSTGIRLYCTNGNMALVKYNSSGSAQWAQTVIAAPGSSEFSGVAVDSPGNVYVDGTQNLPGTYTYNSGVSATNQSTTGDLFGVLVKYAP